MFSLLFRFASADEDLQRDRQRSLKLRQHRHIHKAVRSLTSTRHAQTYGLFPQKGTIAVGADADIAIWDPEKRVRITKDLVHDNTGYTPYEGRELTGWPVTVLSRGEIIVDNGKLSAERGRGRFLARQTSDALMPLGRQIPEMAQLAAWDTPLKS